MNRNMKLPAIQRIAMEFERENDIMDQRQEMMEDVIDDAFEDEEEETDEIVNQVLDEIGIDLSQSVRPRRDRQANVSARGDSSDCSKQATWDRRACAGGYWSRR